MTAYIVPFQSYHRLLFKFWTRCIFEPPFGGITATYTVHLRFIGKLVVDFRFVLIELSSLSVTANFSRSRGRPPRTIFARIDRPVNALQLCCWQYSHKKVCSKLSSSKVQFYTENGLFAFLRPVWELRGNVRCSFRLIGKRLLEFLLVLIELFC